jgi:hypothetical protein
MTQAESHGEDHNAGQMVYVAELQCFLCGSLAGSIESEHKTLPARAVWRPYEGGDPVHATDWRQLRCSRCGGALFAESIEAVTRPDQSEELRREVPRRGRPPKWLVEERRRKRDSASSLL